MTGRGSKGEHRLQKKFKTEHRASEFYENQMLDFLNPHMQKFISGQGMVFIATSDSRGECDCSFRAGYPGFMKVLGEKRIAYPEYRGNGVLASLGNISENPHVGIFFVDFFDSTVGLHVNGKARILENEAVCQGGEEFESLKTDIVEPGGRKPECWVLVDVEEAYIHCSKHIPLLKNMDKKIHWGTDNEKMKKGNYFKTKKKKPS